MIRRLVKTAFCHAAAWARLEAWIERGQPVVIGYHRVLEDDPGEAVMPGLWISLRMLERHLDWIGRRCRFVSLDELGALLEAGSVRTPVAAVTFDDGYADIHGALPMLRRKGIPAAVFVVSDAVEGGKALLHDRVYRAMVWTLRGDRAVPPVLAACLGDRGMTVAGRRPDLLTSEVLAALRREEILRLLETLEADGPELADGDGRSLAPDTLRALHATGTIIGSHTRTHARLIGASRKELDDEVAGSLRDLETRLGAPVRHFAYPDGQFDRAAVRAVERAGYRFAYTACRHRDPARPALTIPRTMLWERSSLGVGSEFSGAVLSCQIHGELGVLDRCPRQHPGTH